MITWKKIKTKFSTGFFSRFHRQIIYTTVLLYSLGVISLVVGLIFSQEVLLKQIPISFLVWVILVPIFILALSFIVQITALMLDFFERVKTFEEQSSFMKSLEMSNFNSNFNRLFITILLEQWKKDIENQNKGILTVHHDYWEICSQFFEFSYNTVECTSVIPLEWWNESSPHHDVSLKKYYDLQTQKLIGRKIKVRRTFILSEPPNDINLFIRLVCQQIANGFEIYYIKLYEAIRDPILKNRLMTDFLLMDDKLLMVGKTPYNSRSVYQYDFHIMKEITQNYSPHQTDLTNIFVDPTKVISGNSKIEELVRELHIKRYRKHINLFDEFLSVPHSDTLKSVLSEHNFKDLT